jgi:hypothetical protein
LNFQPERDGLSQVPAFAANFECLGLLGTGGCGFEQQLEAMLKALTPSTADTTFANGTVGHGDGENAGFLRPDSLLAVILVTDEDDCSVRDPDFFERDSAAYPTNINLRCAEHPEGLHSVERYVDGLLALRDNPDRLVFSAIVGVPTRLVPDPTEVSYDELLDAPELMPRPASDTMLETSCQTETGLAYPPRRIVQVARELEERESNSVITSICQSDFGPAIDAIVAKIAESLGGACIPRPLNPNSEGKVRCEVLETLPAPDSVSDGRATSCAELRALGRRPANCPDRVELDDCYDAMNVPPRLSDSGGEICKVAQVPRPEPAEPGGTCTAPTGANGWFYDDCTAAVRTPESRDFCDSGQRIGFTEGAEPGDGVLVDLECLQAVQSPEAEGTERGSPCDPSETTACTSAGAGRLCCEDAQRELQVRCEVTADCNEANLGGFVCPPRGLLSQLGLSAPVCVNPTCES